MEQVFCKKCDSEKKYEEVKKNLNLCPDCNSDLSAGLKSSPIPKTKTTSTKKKNESKTIEVSTHKGNSTQFQPVTIEDIKMPFSSMILFMIKWAIASIPAIIILFLIWMMVMGVFGVGIATLFK